MKDRLKDLFKCFILSLKISMIPIALGLIIGIIIGIKNRDFQWILTVEWIYRLAIYMSCFGLFLCCIAFMHPIHMRELDYEKTWREKFSEFGLIKVIAYICTFILIYGLLTNTILFFTVYK